MEVAPKYRDIINGYSLVVLKDDSGYLAWERNSIESLCRDLLKDTRRDIEILAIYQDTNHAAREIIHRVIEDLKRGKEVDLENLLK